LKALIKKSLNLLGFKIIRTKKIQVEIINEYKKNGFIPWSEGYLEYRNEFIRKILNNKTILELFETKKELPYKFGIKLDERCVEYPWLFSELNGKQKRILDAGSALNHIFIVEQDIIKNSELVIITLAPEGNCFWQNGISYIYHDLRDIPYKDSYFDNVVCISTLEHIGMDNRLYTNSKGTYENRVYDFKKAINSIKRVLKEDGKLFLTVPFGKYENHGNFQQFDLDLINEAVSTFAPKKYSISYYRYDTEGWQISDAKSCESNEYSEYALNIVNNKTRVKYKNYMSAGASAVACAVITK
jgi:SAM-dependent methyltransferase